MSPTLSRPSGRSATHSPGLHVVLVVVLVRVLGGTAMAHPGGDSSFDHLIVEGIGYLVAAFMLYLALSFARQVLYPRVRALFEFE